MDGTGDKDQFTDAKLQDAKNLEMQSMSDFGAFEAVPWTELTSEEQRNIISSRWVHRRKSAACVRSRLVCRGYSEKIDDLDDIFASTPMMSTFRTMLVFGLSRGWKFYTGDVSTAFLHADVKDERLLVSPPPGEDLDDNGEHFVWRLKKAMYGL